MTGHIVALGGGGFSMEPDDPRLDDHVLSLTGARRPRVLFVPTASGDSPDHRERFLAAFPPERADASVLTLWLLPGSACPHHDGEPRRRPVYRELVAGGFPGGYAADDGAALVFTDGVLSEVVASRPGARAHRVELRDGRVHEDPLPVRLLAPGDPRTARSDP